MDPEEIENRQFLVQLRGYARDEVESFREEVAQEIKILRKQLTKATSDLSHANSELASLKSQLAEVTAQLTQERSRPAPEPEPRHDAEPAPVEDRASMFRMVGQETERILLAAEEAAEQIHEQAQKESAELMADTRMRVERSLAEFEAARRAAEEDFAGIRDSRSMVASQLEDIRRRLEETISRLRVPVELPGSKPASRFRPQADPVDRGAAPDRRPIDVQGQQRQQREMEAARELQARQTAHRGDAERREAELKAVHAEAEQRARADAERQARERTAAEAAARKAQQAAELQAAVAAAQEADRLKAVREAERVAAAEAASAAVKARADEQAAATARRDAERAEAEKARAEADRAAKAEAERAARAEAARAAEEVEAKKKRQAGKEQAAEAQRKAPESKSSAQRAEPPSSKPAGDGGSSLDELLAEIRRKREEEERQAAPAAEQPAAKTAGATGAGELVRRSEALGDLPAQTARRLKRLLQEEHNELLDRLRTQRGKGTLEDNLASHSEQLGRFVSGLTDALSRAFSEGGKAAGGGGDSDASAAITKLVTRQVLNPLRNEISKALEAGLQAEDSAAALSERANDVFRVWKGVRTQLLGEGIAYSAYHHGMIDAWGSRTGSKKQWVLSEEEQECPNDICRRNSEAGDVVLKAPFPSGHLAPPAHGGCNCTLKGA